MTLRTFFHCAFLALLLLLQDHSARASDTVIQRFGTTPDGLGPFTPLVADASGNLYGAAEQGGKYGQGVVYELSPPTGGVKTWTQTALYSFPPSKKIGQPQGALVTGPNGVLYGTAGTLAGGYPDTCTVFQLTPPVAGSAAWSETDLYRFYEPLGGACSTTLIGGTGGVLYGSLPNGNLNINGAIFELTPPVSASAGWTMNIIYSFPGCRTARDVPGNLVMGHGGVLYGTTANCGTFGKGSVFKLTPPTSSQAVWTESEIYSFAADSLAFTSLSIGTNGMLVGTLPLPSGSGAIAALVPPVSGHKAWTQTLIYTFDTDTEGSNPVVSLIPGAGGSLIGTTMNGGANGFGTAFRLSPPATGQTQWHKTVLHSFNGRDGGDVAAALIKGPGSLLYGVSPIGGLPGNGTVFSLSPPTASQPDWVETPLYSFSGVAASGPNATLIGDGTGALYGMSGSGRTGDMGSVAAFKLTPPATGQAAWSYEQLYTFGTGTLLGEPQAPLIKGKNGAFYGMDPTNESQLFVLTPPTKGMTAWTRTTIVDFDDITDDIPIGTSLIQGPDGTFYGTTHGGNAFAVSPPIQSGDPWTANIIFKFPKGFDYENIQNNFLTIGSDGVLYGTSSFTGMASSEELGTVFTLTRPEAGQSQNWTQTILYSFLGGTDGAQPNGPLLIGPGGTLYGTTLFGGDDPGGAGNPSSGDGTVFALSPPAAGETTWTESVLYRFKGGLDGSSPESTLIRGKDGALYGITSFGGNDVDIYSAATPGHGTVYKLTPPLKDGGVWAHRVLHRFTGGQDGIVPLAGLMLNTDGKLYGTSAAGGGTGSVVIALAPAALNPGPLAFPGSGTVFQITP